MPCSTAVRYAAMKVERRLNCSAALNSFPHARVTRESVLLTAAPASPMRVQESVFEVQRQISLNKIREAEIANKWAMGMFRKDSELIREARSDLAEWNRDNPNTPIQIKMPQIIKRVRQMNLNKTDRIAKTAPKEIRNQVRDELREAQR